MVVVVVVLGMAMGVLGAVSSAAGVPSSVICSTPAATDLSTSASSSPPRLLFSTSLMMRLRLLLGASRWGSPPLPGESSFSQPEFSWKAEGGEDMGDREGEMEGEEGQEEAQEEEWK